MKLFFVALFGAFMLATLASAPDARAHSEVIASAPADGAVLASSPERISLRFTAPMQITSLRILDFAGREQSLQRQGSRTAAVTEAQATLASPLPPGAFRIEFRGISADGHVGGGAVNFLIDPTRR
ncbi:MAG TPA: copper resistance protein CopC [Roseococcus sp.]|jgi:methionine-rich copper-binding protein CopC|nr:copper resistance protein CopC [Roseococcus sp.]